jgi:hypothetical protein
VCVEGKKAARPDAAVAIMPLPVWQQRFCRCPSFAASSRKVVHERSSFESSKDHFYFYFVAILVQIMSVVVGSRTNLFSGKPTRLVGN